MTNADTRLNDARRGFFVVRQTLQQLESQLPQDATGDAARNTLRNAQQQLRQTAETLG